MKREEQMSFAAARFERLARSTKRAAFLSEMDRIVPRIYLLQQWLNPGDPTVEEALYDSKTSIAAKRASRPGLSTPSTR